MLEDHNTPRHPIKPPCQKCDDKGFVKEAMKNGDTVTNLCPVCLPPKSSQK